MTRQIPDERFSAAARDALVDMAGAPAPAARPARSRWVLQAVVAAVVLGLVVGVSVAVLRTVRSGAPTLPAATGTPIPHPSRVPCGAGKGDGFAPFGCNRFEATRGSGALDWLNTYPMTVGFGYTDTTPQILIDVHCNFTSADVALSTTTLRVDVRSGGMTLAACANDHSNDARAFFGQPVRYTLSGDTLTLDNGTTVIHLRRTR